MALNNKLRKIVDQPVWEWMRYVPFTTATTNTFITTQAGDTGSWQHRYIYALNNTDQWRYDTYSDAWSYMGAIYPLTPVSAVTGVWKKDDGHVGRFISAVSGSKFATGAFLDEHAVVGLKIKVISGPGRGTVRTIVNASNPVTVEEFTIGAYQNQSLNANPGAVMASNTYPATKRWFANRWVGYALKVFLGTSQQYFIRRIIGSNRDSVFFADPSLHASDPQMANLGFFDTNTIAPSTSFGSRAVIQYNTIEVDEPWPENMDYSSRFEIQTGILHSVQNIATAGFFRHYMYDPLLASWFPGKPMTNIIPNYLLNTELQIESIDASLAPTYVTSSLTSGSVRSAQDTTQNWSINQWANYRFINKTTGYERAILSNTSNTLIFGQDLDIPPSGSNAYEIVADSDKLYMNGGNFSTMAQYSCRTNTWLPSQRIDEGVVNGGYVRYSSSYEAMYPLSGITRSGNVLTVSTLTNVPFKPGDRIFVSGALGADSIYYNGFFTIQRTDTFPGNGGVGGMNQWLKSFTVTASATPAANAVIQSSTSTVIYDMSKNWQTNELVGDIAMVYDGEPVTPLNAFRLITANSSQSFTVGSGFPFTPTGVAYGYAILNSASFGTSWGLDNSPVTGTSSFSVTGSTRSTSINQLFFSASYLPILQQIPKNSPITGSGLYANTYLFDFDEFTNPSIVTASFSGLSAAGNFDNVVYTFDLKLTRGFGVVTGGASGTTLTDSTKQWTDNQWAGARLKIIAGTNAGLEVAITANTNNTLTFTTFPFPVDTTSVYNILPIQPRNTTSTTAGAGGADLKWTYGTAEPTLHPSSSIGKYIWCFQAGATMRVEKYNIATMQYEYPFIAPFNHMTGENLSTGTMYAYDGKGRIYIQPNASARIIYIDTDRDRSEVAGQIPAGMSTARQGRRFWVKKTEDGLDYLYIARHSDTPFWRQLMPF
jgi:hypothetical protein